jgi:hypothetical protein
MQHACGAASRSLVALQKGALQLPPLRCAALLLLALQVAEAERDLNDAQHKADAAKQAYEVGTALYLPGSAYLLSIYLWSIASNAPWLY